MSMRILGLLGVFSLMNSVCEAQTVVCSAPGEQNCDHFVLPEWQDHCNDQGCGFPDPDDPENKWICDSSTSFEVQEFGTVANPSFYHVGVYAIYDIGQSGNTLWNQDNMICSKKKSCLGGSDCLELSTGNWVCKPDPNSQWVYDQYDFWLPAGDNCTLTGL